MEKTYKPVRTAVVGCGAISDIYFTNMIERYDNLEVVACCAKHIESAQRQGSKYGIKACTYEEILADPTIEMVVILTPAPTHFELIEQALLHGKHAFTEKPMTTNLADAEKLLKLANEKGLYLGAAPETFLGSGVQTARKAIDDGLIGDVTSFHVVANRDTDMLASLFQFLRVPGGGICYDYGVYYLTALINLLGPIDSVYAVTKNLKKVRKNIFPNSPEFGQNYIYDNESQVDALITLETGVTGTFALNGDSILMDLGYFTIHGTKGVLVLGDANQFGATVTYYSNDYMAFLEGKDTKRILDSVSPLSDNCRGIGPADMAHAIRLSCPNRASKELSYHVLETVVKIVQSSETQTVQKVESTCERAECFADWDAFVHEESVK